jgi:hypothetical protein
MRRLTKAINEDMLAACKIQLKKEGIRENGRRLQAENMVFHKYPKYITLAEKL